jgi:hypothetical protein
MMGTATLIGYFIIVSFLVKVIIRLWQNNKEEDKRFK